jgi:hypothetical protein
MTADAPAAASLLTLGPSAILNRVEAWPDYPTLYGLSDRDIPALIQLATDLELALGDVDAPETWAPLYARRALGQLRAAAAAEPLLQLFDAELEDARLVEDALLVELPLVYRLIGPAAIKPLKAHMGDRSKKWLSRAGAAEALAIIGRHYEVAYHDCVRALTQQLQEYVKQNPEFNGFLITFLIRLGAVEMAPLMEQVFAHKKVDRQITGDWDQVQADLGLIPYSELQRRRYEAAHRPLVDFAVAARSLSGGQGFGPSHSAKKKSKRKSG